MSSVSERSGPRIAVVAEKPAVARDIAAVVGARRRADGYLFGNGYVVTWAIGHLVALAQPHEIDPAWKQWRRDRLPMLPATWPLIIGDGTRSQFEVVRKILGGEQIDEVICATDAGREGELIFRYIYEAAGCSKPVRRLWISSLTADAIRSGFDQLRAGVDLEPLADAARGRSRADWLVGMNLSRAFTLANDEQLTIGRVQTPTLAMVVERELAIRNFVAEEYFEVVARFDPSARGGHAPSDDVYEGTWFRGDKPTVDGKRLGADGEANTIVERVRSGAARVEAVKDESKRLAPPLLYDLTELQRHANRLYGMSAKKTLTVAQQLYEQRKLISYPRTDSRHLSADVAATLPEVVAAIRGPYEELLAPGTGVDTLGRRFVDDKQVSDHHAIIPTKTSPGGVALSQDEQRIYDLICRRLLSAWHGDHVWSVRTVITAVTATVDGANIVDRFHSTGNTVLENGWKVLDVVTRGRARTDAGAKGAATRKSERVGPDRSLPSILARGLDVEVATVEAVAKKTKPPPHFTEATLLTAMETAGRQLDDKELAAAMRERGLGTPATRAEIIENLLRREYMERTGKILSATDKGIRLIELVHPQVKSPALTGEWESQLARIERGEESLDRFMAGIETFVRSMVDGAFAGARSRPRAAAAAATSSTTHTSSSSSDGERHRHGAGSRRKDPDSSRRPAVSSSARPAISSVVPSDHPTSTASRLPATQREPVSEDQLEGLLRSTFKLDSFRPYQEAVCRAATRGEDVLLVMPTGAGKSLCYQLPGLARGGTTLVVSPLIALMEDQVAKLVELGLRAERIHSGRDRQTSREVCRAYLDGRLDFLFIAPERLSVPGFPEMLAKRKPSLIAIDEAHCISAWGHDFRPDYRLLGGRLPILRPSPVVAATATATPIVQDDIAAQLGLVKPSRHIHGFRRHNIAVEVSELAPSTRLAAVHRILAEPSARPAIVYAPTRKEADRIANELGGDLRSAAYHAGMGTAARDRVQTRFLGSELDVIVATIAFGMGIDKADVRTVIHTGLPGSLESYYQEIGRAGRDGAPSRAILLYSWADRKTHEFFHGRDYPDISVLERVFKALTSEYRSMSSIESQTGVEEDELHKSLEKLWIHGGADITPDEQVARGGDRWREPYREQSAHKLGQLEDMVRFADTSGCRMLQLVRHFGDQNDSGELCGMCDVCSPDSCVVQCFRRPTPTESSALHRSLHALRERDNQTTGQLYRVACDEEQLDRKGFERCLSGLVRAGLVDLEEDSFLKDGRKIAFQRAALTREGAFGDIVAIIAALQVPDEPPAATKRVRTRRTRGAASGKGGRTRKKAAKAKPFATLEIDASPAVVEALKEWRLGEARSRKVPAFTILTDKTLTLIAAARPSDVDELLQIKGVGPAIVKKHGADILRVLASV